MAADGRIEPGDMLLEVNDINFETMTNDDAVRTLREIVQTPGYVIRCFIISVILYHVRCIQPYHLVCGKVLGSRAHCTKF